MKVTQKGQLYQLTSFPYLFPINCYLWEEATHITLIDTATAFNSKKIIKVIEQLHKPLKYIILTHAHNDHIGGLANIKRHFPDSQILLHKRESTLYMDYLKKIKNNTGSLSLQLNNFIKEGSKVDDFLVIETPGHTDGSLSLYHQATQVFICGDLVQTQGGYAICGDTRRLFPFPSTGTKDLVTSIQSMEKVAKYPIQMIACGHGALRTLQQTETDEIITRAKKVSGLDG